MTQLIDTAELRRLIDEYTHGDPDDSDPTYALAAFVVIRGPAILAELDALRARADAAEADLATIQTECGQRIDRLTAERDSLEEDRMQLIADRDRLKQRAETPLHPLQLSADDAAVITDVLAHGTARPTIPVRALPEGCCCRVCAERDQLQQRVAELESIIGNVSTTTADTVEVRSNQTEKGESQ
jgi:hypothetical protein